MYMKDSCTYNEVIPNPPKLGVPGALIRVTFIQWQKAILFSLLPSKVMLLGRHHCGTPPRGACGKSVLAPAASAINLPSARSARYRRGSVIILAVQACLAPARAWNQPSLGCTHTPTSCSWRLAAFLVRRRPHWCRKGGRITSGGGWHPDDRYVQSPHRKSSASSRSAFKWNPHEPDSNTSKVSVGAVIVSESRQPLLAYKKKHANRLRKDRPWKCGTIVWRAQRPSVASSSMLKPGTQ